MATEAYKEHLNRYYAEQKQKRHDELLAMTPLGRSALDSREDESEGAIEFARKDESAIQDKTLDAAVTALKDRKRVCKSIQDASTFEEALPLWNAAILAEQKAGMHKVLSDGSFSDSEKVTMLAGYAKLSKRT